MSERYTHQLLKVVVAQVCQTIGWHSIQSTPLELMMDILDQYLRDITRLTHRYSELYNRTDPNLDDVALAYRDIGINLGDLQEYLQFVDPIARPFEVPKYPLPKETHLNFMKPGSKEVLTRPVHIPEHMPPMLVDSEEEKEEDYRRQRLRAQLLEEEEQATVEEVKPDVDEFVEKFEEVGAEEVAMMETGPNEEVVTFKRPPEFVTEGGQEAKKPRTLPDEGRPTREISSVIMTTSGFISPAREGKLPDSKVPEIPEEKPKPAPPPPPPPVTTVLPVSKMDDKFAKKGRKKPVEKEKKKDKKVEKKKEGGEKEAASRPATPAAVPVAEVKPLLVDTEDVKPVLATLDPPPKPPTPVPDIKPPEPLLPPPEIEKPALPVTPVKPTAKVKKERVPRKKKQQQPKQKSPVSAMPMNPAMNMGGLFSPQNPPLLMNQITPPKPPKPKRPKLTKKQIQQQYMDQLQQFQAPLNAQSILEMFSPGKKPLPGLFQPSMFPPPQQLMMQKPNFSEHPAQTQLDILQKLHPSLEITPSPGPSTAGPAGLHSTSPDKHKLNIFKKVAKKEPSPVPTTQGPIIIIDDDKSPPHQPQFPTTPMAKKRLPKTSTAGVFPFQDTLSSPDLPFNISMNSGEHSGIGLMSSFSREFSPPKTPSNMPKTPDIKLQSSSSSSASWMSDSGKLNTGPGPLFGDFPNFGLPAPKEEKKKRQRQKQPRAPNPKKAKNNQLMSDFNLLQQFQHQQSSQQQLPPVSTSSIDKKPLQDAVSSYAKLLNQAMPPAFLSSQVRNPMFGMFPLPSGPGLIPENPLFNSFPGQPSFLPTGPFGMPPMPPRFDIGNLLRYPRPPKAQPVDNYDNLDPETKLAHTPLDLQKSTCNVAPLVPPSLQIDPMPVKSSVGSRKQVSPAVKERQNITQIQQQRQHTIQPPPQEHSLNLSTKTAILTNQTTVQKPPIVKAIHPEVRQPVVAALPPQKPEPPPTQTPMLNIATAAQLQQLAPLPPNVLPIAPGETIIIGSDSDTNSQSTVTMTAMGLDEAGKKDKTEKRKSKEHKKDRKLKEGKIKKKKDKKDKNRSKDRDRERPKSSHSFHPDGAIEPIPSDIVSAPVEELNPQQEQFRRKEKKEKKKEKLKKEKRKEKERVAAAALEAASFSDHHRSSFGLGSTSAAGTTTASSSDQRDHSDGSTASVPKLMLKLGSSANPSPRSNTPDVTPLDVGVVKEEKVEVKREASPELARISALVTRPPKLKAPPNKGKIKEEEGGKLSKLVDHSGKAAGKPDLSADVATKPRPRGIQALPDSIDLFSVTPTHNPSTVQSNKASSVPSSSASTSSAVGVSGDQMPHSAKKQPKESKTSSKSHGSISSSSASVSLGVTIPAPLSASVNVKDADGNVVWICPACGRVDDGTPMIGCDGCDAWYHWVCVGIQVPPDSNEDWYCRVCIGKKQESHGDEKQRKRKKKDKRNPKE
ncbi:transcription initiation factor TFIID subunit 3-like [Topomyia yanbarensis]|uniref:transcription initiation factor TFIID subunit 3-like n=1 Tax=Topomyia yanbarensis TaxID=2498891 RepID=UPI00273BE0A4|nr:transcription initiation factor TFIID subunit 3-like [Topomyia yanbarensis]